MRLTEQMILARAKKHSLDEIKRVNIWGCDLTDISILENMPNIEVLALSVNKISSLKPLQRCFRLQELYLRNNTICDLNELAHLQHLPLKHLVLSENPCCINTSNYRIDIIKILPNLRTIDDVEITRSEREQAASFSEPIERETKNSRDEPMVEKSLKLLPEHSLHSTQQQHMQDLAAFNLQQKQRFQLQNIEQQPQGNSPIYKDFDRNSICFPTETAYKSKSQCLNRSFSLQQLAHDQQQPIANLNCQLQQIQEAPNLLQTQYQNNMKKFIENQFEQQHRVASESLNGLKILNTNTCRGTAISKECLQAPCTIKDQRKSMDLIDCDVSLMSQRSSQSLLCQSTRNRPSPCNGRTTRSLTSSKITPNCQFTKQIGNLQSNTADSASCVSSSVPSTHKDITVPPRSRRVNLLCASLRFILELDLLNLADILNAVQHRIDAVF